MSDDSSTYAITGIKAGVTTTTVPLRLEVDSWYPGQTAEHLKQNNLFFYALRFLQQRDPEKKLSFFQIAGEYTELGIYTFDGTYATVI